MLFLTFMLVGAVLLAVFTRSKGGKPAGKREKSLPERLPVQTKRYFFSRSENAFFGALTAALRGTHYVIFPNVRLNDIFQITANSKDRPGVYARLRDKHVDFLIVTAGDYQPVCAIELDGASHASAVQQGRDAVKDLVFRSAGLPLKRLDAQRPYIPAELQKLLLAQLPKLRDQTAD